MLLSCKPGAMPCHALRLEHTFTVDSVHACVLCVCTRIQRRFYCCVFFYRKCGGGVLRLFVFLWACAPVKGYSVCLRTPQECLGRPAPVIAT